MADAGDETPLSNKCAGFQNRIAGIRYRRGKRLHLFGLFGLVFELVEFRMVGCITLQNA